MKGRPPRGSEIGHDGGSRVIQSHASFYPSESTTQRRTSICHATCEKRGSEVAAHAGTVWCCVLYFNLLEGLQLKLRF